VAEPTKIIVRKMTQSQLQSLGGNIFINSKKWTWIIAVILACGFGGVLLSFYKHTIAVNIISVVPVIVVFVGCFYTFNKAGKKFWQKIKDIPEPIDISKFTG